MVRERGSERVCNFFSRGIASTEKGSIVPVDQKTPFSPFLRSQAFNAINNQQSYVSLLPFPSFLCCSLSLFPAPITVIARWHECGNEGGNKKSQGISPGGEWGFRCKSFGSERNWFNRCGIFSFRLLFFPTVCVGRAWELYGGLYGTMP